MSGGADAVRPPSDDLSGNTDDDGMENLLDSNGRCGTFRSKPNHFSLRRSILRMSTPR